MSRENKNYLDRFRSEGILPESDQIVIDALIDRLTPQRKKKLQETVSKRSKHFIGIMEHIYDQGNVHAVIRSSEGLGFYRLGRIAAEHQKHSSRTTSGADKWMEIVDFKTPSQAVHHYRSHGYRIGATAMTPKALPLEEVDFSKPTALFFGNEKDGCGPESLELSDFHCRIPMLGFTQSFNISVAAAITFYHVRSFLRASKKPYLLTPSEQKNLTAKYLVDAFAHRPAFLKEIFKSTSSCPRFDT
ncbi:MAG: RNA methyltransferase [Bacteriovoracales bacterium]|nr:RNA methyltransferase [Bacteriovoracales bacterium]